MMNVKADISWSLFLDRDGVINERNFDGYITSIDEFKFLEQVKEGLKELSKYFKYIFVITNQQGVGKGEMTVTQLDEIHAYMLAELKKEGIHIDKVYFAANLREAEEDRRKPNPAMGKEAQLEFPELDFEKSIMVGDTDSDIHFGKNLGMKTVLIHSKEKVSASPDLIVNNLMELAHALEKWK